MFIPEQSCPANRLRRTRSGANPAAHIVELDSAKNAVIQTAAESRLQHAHGIPDKLVNAVAGVSFIHLIGATLRTTRVPHKIVEKMVFLSHARAAGLAFKYQTIEYFFKDISASA
jgi:hypothetical protein